MQVLNTDIYSICFLMKCIAVTVPELDALQRERLYRCLIFVWFLTSLCELCGSAVGGHTLRSKLI